VKDLLRTAELRPGDLAALLRLAGSYKWRPPRRRALLANASVVEEATDDALGRRARR
jgi:hypothetical protein